MRLALISVALACAPVAALADTQIAFGPQAEKKLADDYGLREKAVLQHVLSRAVDRAFGDLDGRTVRLTVLDVTPSRPTFQQMSDRPGLSFVSFGVGGAEVEGVVLDASGREVARATTRWYETDIFDSQFEWTWGDAQTAFNRAARNLAKAAAGSPG